MSEIRPIKTDADLDATLRRIDEIFDAPEGSPEDDELDILVTLVERYEDEHYPIPPVSPIAAIEFMMDQKGLTPRDLIPYIGSRAKVSEVLSGKRDITMAMARALHKHLGIPGDVLLQDSSVSLEGNVPDLDWKRFPLREMAKRGWIPNSSDLMDKAEETILGLMGRAGGQPVAAGALFRKGDLRRVNAKTDDYALGAWCWQVMAQASESPPNADYESGSVTPEFLREIATLSRWSNGPLQARDALAENGISLQVVPHLPRTYLDGAAMWIDGKRPVIGLTLRYDRIDNFWFTLLHELGHLGRHLDGNTSTVFCDDLSLREPRAENPAVNDVEIEADILAEEALIPPSGDWESSLLFENNLSPIEVMELAQKHKVHPAVVAGRIRYEQRNYRLLSQFVGTGEVRKQFEEE